MTSIHAESAFIDWIKTTLAAGGLAVGDGEAPSLVPAGAGYVVVHSIAGGVTEGTLDAPRSDGSPNVQVTSVGASPQQTRSLVDKVRSLLNAAVPAVLGDGRSVIWLDFPLASVTVLRDDDVQPPKFYCPDRMEMGTVV